MDDYPANAPGQGDYGDPWVFQQVRTAIREGKYAWAETLLDGVRDHGAEWHFLMGALCFRKGWMDEAQRHYEFAAQMDAGNEEYRRAAERMRNGPCYHPKERPFGTLFAENLGSRVCVLRGLRRLRNLRLLRRHLLYLLPRD
jgi:molecular chaperone DnaJ